MLVWWYYHSVHLLEPGEVSLYQLLVPQVKGLILCKLWPIAIDKLLFRMLFVT